MMRKAFLLALTVAACEAAVIRGSVVENVTGKPLARTAVLLQPIAGTPVEPISQRTNRFGGFEFDKLPAGAYVVSVSRPGFAPAQYGQKEWNSAGQPIFLEEAASTFLSIRLRRLGAITGAVLDEEEIGLPDYEVMVYRNTRPPQVLSRVKTDDRGIYRLGGLMPGSYLVRTATRQYDEGSYLATFSRETLEAGNAHAVDVNLDDQANNVNVKPRTGQLITLAGTVLVPELGLPVTVTLVSEMVRIEQQGSSFRFTNLMPGAYELFAQTPNDNPLEPTYGAYLSFVEDRDRNTIKLQAVRLNPIRFEYAGTRGEPMDSNKSRLLYRRKDLAGTGETKRIPPEQKFLALPPGHWEFMLAPVSTSYVARFQAPRWGAQVGRPDGWNETRISGSGDLVRFVVSTSPASIRGTATTGAQVPVIGAPVFLEAWDETARKRVIDLRETRTDMRGQYQFTGLAPGTYRVLSTFEYLSPDSTTMENAGAKTVKVEEGQALQLDLDVYVIR